MPSNLAYIITALAILLILCYAIKTFPKREFKTICAYVRMKIFGFNFSSAATLINNISSEILKENPDCSELLRTNVTAIRTGFHSLKKLNKANKFSDVEKEMCSNLFDETYQLFDTWCEYKTPALEEKTQRILSRLRPLQKAMAFMS